MPIIPESTPLTGPYWAAARQGQLLLQRCATCSGTWHPPQPVCPDCASENWAWFGATGTGQVHSFTVVHHSAHQTVRDALPYVIALIRTAEGPLVLMNLLEVEAAAVTVGMPVVLRLGPAPGGEHLVQAHPAPV